MIQFFFGANDLTSSAPTGNGTSITLNKPAAIADGDLLIAEVFFQNANGTPAITPPAGWTRLGPAVPVTPLRPSGIYVLPVPSAAAVSATSWTWSTNVAAGRCRGMIFRATGVDLTTPQDASGTWSSDSGTSSVVLPSVNTTTAGAALLTMAYTNSAAGLGYPTLTPPSPMATIANINTTPDSSANSALWAGYEIMSVAGTTGTRTVTISPATTNSGGYMVALKAAGAPPQPTVIHNIAGAVTSSSFQVAYKTSNVATGVRVVASTAADLSNPIYSSTTVPDGAGYGRTTVSGLTANTVYYWALELDGAVSGSFHGRTRTYQPANTRASFSFVTGSCVNTGDNPVTFDNMRVRTGLDGLPARFFAHLGDFHYVYSTGGGNPIAPEDQAILRENYAGQIAQPRQHQMFREIPLAYSWSDIDSFGSNCDGTYAANDEANAAYRQVFPIPADMPATAGIYRTWVIGRVRFIQVDMRTFASSKSATDNSSKTKLGATQKAWFLNLIQNTYEPVVVWLGDGAWFGAASTNGSNESWSAYNTERTELGNAIAASKRHLIYIHGDTHTLAADSGANNAWGGFPIVSAAPMSRPDMNPWPTGAGWTVSQGSYPSSSQAGTAYGWFDLTDNGGTIQLDYHGYDVEVERISMSVTWQTPLHEYRRGDGTVLKPYVKINGSLVDLG